MENFSIEECSNSDYMQLSRGITNFNLQHLPANADKHLMSLGYVARVKGKLVGGVVGKLLLGQNLSIDILWVIDEFRHKGVGSRLLSTLEENAKRYGSSLAVVDTFDFQALDFYKKQGYTVFGELKDSPYKGNVRYYLFKQY